jgi:hypothetical protein
MYLQKVISRKTFTKNLFFVCVWKVVTKMEGSGSGSISQRHGSADPDQHQNVMDPQHCSLPYRIEITKKYGKGTEQFPARCLLILLD